MKKIKMLFNGRELEFDVTYECPSYCFCECPANPGARGFFTTGYIMTNRIS